MRYIRLALTVSNWFKYLFVKFGLTGEDPLVLRLRSGVNIEVPRRLLHTFKEVFMDASYVQGMPLPVPDKPTIIDIGANAGYFSLQALSHHPDARIIAYEPVPVNFAQLQRNIALNSEGRIDAVQSAVFNKKGKIKLFLDPNDTFTTSASAVTQHNSADIEVELPCTTLDDLLDQHDVQQCDLLKIDCEGAEYAILYNVSPAGLAKIRQMIVEVHERDRQNGNIRALAAFLEDSGLRVAAKGDLLWAWHA